MFFGIKFALIIIVSIDSYSIYKYGILKKANNM